MKVTGTRILSIHCEAHEVHACEKAVKVVLRKCSDGEIHAIIDALQNGDINGCVSSGPRACLIGTLSRLRNMTTEECRTQLALAPEIMHDVEYWFFQICSATTETKQNTENNHFALFVSLWCEQVLSERTHTTHPDKGGSHTKIAILEKFLQRVLISEKTERIRLVLVQ